MRVISTDRILLKGRYLITDPCYVYGDDDWNKFCELLFGNEEQVTGVSEKTVPRPNYDAIDCPDPKDTIKAIFALDKEYEAARREAQLKLNERRRSIITLFEIRGKQIPVMSTSYGDGYYPVFNPLTGYQVGSFGVDAGLFAFIPWEAERSDLGPIIELEGELVCD